MLMTSTARPRTHRTPAQDSRAPERPHSAHRYGAGFWTIAAVFVMAMAFSTVPTPLYPL